MLILVFLDTSLSFVRSYLIVVLLHSKRRKVNYNVGTLYVIYFWKFHGIGSGL